MPRFLNVRKKRKSTTRFNAAYSGPGLVLIRSFESSLRTNQPTNKRQRKHHLIKVDSIGLLILCLCPSEPELRQSSSAGNLGTQTPVREKGPSQYLCDESEKRRFSDHNRARSMKQLERQRSVTVRARLTRVFTASSAVSDSSPEELLRQLQEERTCKVCMDKLVSIVFIPCGHLVVCGDCAASLRHCPICRAVIRGSVRAFMS